MIDRALEEKVAAAVAAALLPRDGVKIVGAYEAAEAGEVKGEVEWALSQIEELLRRTNFNAHQTRVSDGTRRDP